MEWHHTEIKDVLCCIECGLGHLAVSCGETFRSGIQEIGEFLQFSRERFSLDIVHDLVFFQTLSNGNSNDGKFLGIWPCLSKASESSANNA